MSVTKKPQLQKHVKYSEINMTHDWELGYKLIHHKPSLIYIIQLDPAGGKY